jgi:hypothetical protein
MRWRAARIDVREIVLAALCVPLVHALATPLQGCARRVVLDAIRFVESSGRDVVPDGDGGKAIGPFQIHRVYWLDAVQSEPALGPVAGFDYQHCRDRRYAERVVAAYMQRYVPAAWARADAEVIARTHNGGPRGAHKSATDGYWRRVERALKRRARLTARQPCRSSARTAPSAGAVRS